MADNDKIKTIRAKYNQFVGNLQYTGSGGPTGQKQSRRQVTQTPQKMSLGQRFSQFASQSGESLEPVTDNTFSTTFGKAYEKIPSVTKNTFNYGMAKNPDQYKVLKLFDESGRFSPHTVEPTQVYGEDFMDLSAEARGQRIKETQDSQVREAYANAGSNPFGTVSGAIAGMVADPTTLAIPGGGSVRAAAGLGAAFGATDMALESKLRKGEIDGSDVAMGAAFGGVAGPLIFLGGKGVSKVLSGALKSRTEVRPEDVNKALDDANVPPEDRPDVDVFATEFNEAASLGKKAAVNKVKEAVKIQGKQMPVESPDELRISVSKILDQYSDELTTKEKEFLTSAKRLYSNLAEGKRFKPKVEKYTTKDGKVRFRRKSGQTQLLKAYDKAMENAEEQIASMYDKSSNQVEGIVDPANKGDRIGKDIGATEEVYENSSSSTAQKAIETGEIQIDSKVGRTQSPPIGKLTDELTEQKADDVVNITATDHWLSTPRNVLKGKMGRDGEDLANSIQAHAEATNWDVANSLNKFKHIILDSGMYRGSGKERKLIGHQVTDILRGDIKPKNADPRAAEIAKGTRQLLNSTVDTMVDRGILSKIQGTALKYSARQQGYAPRVINQQYLATSKGEKHFKQVLGEHKFSKKRAEDIAKKYRGKDSEGTPKGVIKNKDGSYRLSQGTISNIYKQRMTSGRRAISSHIEKERTLDLPDSVLKPFLHNDIRDIMNNYVYDVYRGANAQKIFGKNGERAADMLNNIHSNYGNEAYNFAANTYALHARVAVEGAERMDKFINMPNYARKTLSWLRGFETTKLYTAQLLNMTQSAVNGTIELSSRVGLPKALGTVYKGIARTFTKEGWEFADRTGAAVQTSIMQMAQAHGELPNRFSEWFLRRTLFQDIEQLQRNFASNIGRTYIEGLLEKQGKLTAQRATKGLSKGQERTLQKTENQLKEMGIMPGKEVSVRDMEMGAQRFSNSTNFVTGADQIPLAWQSPEMSLVRQFKSFAFLQGKFLKDNIISPMKKGEFGSALNALAALGIAPLAAGGLPIAVGEFRKWWYTGELSEDNFERMLTAYTSIGGLGLIFDTALRATNTTGERFLSGMAGPGIGTVTNLTTGTGNSMATLLSEDEDPTAEPLIRSILKEIPGGHIARKNIYDQKGSGYGSLYESSFKGATGTR